MQNKEKEEENMQKAEMTEPAVVQFPTVPYTTHNHSV
jgi:hypothetical protein